MRNEIQRNALNALIYNQGGTIVLDTGTGKTKVAIDFMLQLPGKIIYILYPRNTLKQNWINELAKWGIKPYGNDKVNFYYQNTFGDTKLISIVFSSIQGIYTRILPNQGKDFIFIADEIHTMCSEAYKQFFYNNSNATVVGLTATPEEFKKEKNQFYRDIAPIVYSYKHAARDGIINGRKYFILRTDLSNVKTKIANWTYAVSEYEVLEYLNRRVKDTGAEIQAYFDKMNIMDGNYFSSASTWCWLKKGTPLQKSLGWPYLRAIQSRKEFMLTQNTTAQLTKNLIYDRHGESYFGDTGILVFSNQISQVQKIVPDKYIVHSKKKKILNEMIISDFNNHDFPVIGSCESLEMGMNFKRAKIAIFESYVGSPTKASQKMGRTDRLPLDEKAIIIILYVNDSPFDGWYRKSGFPKFEDVTVFTDLNELRKAVNQYV